MIRFLWRSSRGYRLTPWKNPYLRWRIETYSGIPADSIAFASFWRFVWQEKTSLRRFLGWTQRMSQ